MGILVIRILISIEPRATIRNSGIKLVRMLIYPLLGILAHLAKELHISPRLGLVGV